MRIQPESDEGKWLISVGVTESELRGARVLRWNWQVGAAITLPVIAGPVLILVKGKYLERGENGAISEFGKTLLRHELCHLRQAKEWGTFKYYMRHLKARIATRSLVAEESSVEKPCYDEARLASAGGSGDSSDEGEAG